jgi:hypothetical protein
VDSLDPRFFVAKNAMNSIGYLGPGKGPWRVQGPRKRYEKEKPGTMAGLYFSVMTVVTVALIPSRQAVVGAPFPSPTWRPIAAHREPAALRP